MMNVPLILALDTAGQPRQWITWEDAVVYHAKGLVAWQHGENDYTFMGGRSRMTGNQSSINTQSIIAVKGAEVGKTRKRTYKEPPITNKLLFRRDRNICAYCGNPFHDSILTRDHIVPQSYGGKDTWMNLVAACKPCNNRKGDKLPGRAGMELLYVPYVPTKHEYLILSNRHILQDQMDFLMTGVGKNSRLYTA
jgi:5-methylcytosine-specific restriction endonuclease McrA